MNSFLSILTGLLSIWTLLFIIKIAAGIRSHKSRGRTMLESIMIEVLVWVLGVGVFIGTFNLSWGTIIPNLERAGGNQPQPEIVQVVKCLFGGCESNSQITTTSTRPDSTPFPTGPVPAPATGDQITRNYAVDGTTKCLITADTGDTGGVNLVNLGNQLGIPCLIIAGDVIYPNGSMENFVSVVKPYLDPKIQTQDVFVTPGNHDWWKGYPSDVSQSWTATELPLCQAFPYLPQGQGKCRYYRLLMGDIEVFFYDADYREPDGNSQNSVQGQWLRAALNSSTAKWKIVITHEPPISSCNHEASSAIANIPFKEWGADALFTGHCHFYERSDWNGLPVLTVGNGGNSIYQFERNNPFSMFRYNSSQGAVVMTVTQAELKFEFMTTGNVILDSLILSK